MFDSVFWLNVVWDVPDYTEYKVFDNVCAEM